MRRKQHGVRWFQLVGFQILVESNAGLRGASLLFIRLGNIWNHLPVEWKHARLCVCVCVCLQGLPGMLSLCTARLPLLSGK